MAICKACGARIRWIKTLSGKAMPCDDIAIPYRQDDAGPLILVTKDGAVIHAVRDKASSQYGYQSHFATCPAASDFRKAR